MCVARITTGFAEARYGTDWLNELLRRLAPGKWVLYADADEFLVYRGAPARPLMSLCSEAEGEGATAVLGFMLDMYPDSPLEDAQLHASTDPFTLAPCFDGDYHFQIRSRKPWETSAPMLEVVGGPRLRLLSSIAREKRATWFDHFLRGQIDRVLPRVSDALVPWVVRLMPRQMPALEKAPLVITGAGISYVNSHNVVGARFHRENVVFCHFKFLADFAAKVRTEAVRGAHYRRGAEYIMYADAIRGRGGIDLRYANTRRFTGAGQLVELGLIRDMRPLFVSGDRGGRPIGHEGFPQPQARQWKRA